MSAYSGNLIRLANSTDARALPGPSPRHALNESDPTLSSAEGTVPTGTGSEYAGSSFDENILPGGGMALDTPASWARDLSANASQIKYAGATPHDSRAVLSLRHANMPDGGRVATHDGTIDNGYKRVAFSGSPIADELQSQEVIETEGYANQFGEIGSPDGVKYVRGRGSRPETNPDGFRLGRMRRWAWEGDAARHIKREQGIQYSQPRDAYIPQQRQSMVKNMLTDVALPRSAGSFDDAIMSGNDSLGTATSGASFGGF